ncbi:MAG: threonine ammonia-lyase [Deltaproteobacteria bacterium]|nr:threonine ammonia-lyase [Deltaproteobacteria bacterium]
MINLRDIKEAYELIKDQLVRTPLKETRHFSKMVGSPLYLKMENLQHTGSFKIRGATNRIMKLSKQEQVRGVVAASAGNHAQGVASIAHRMEIKATIFMPEPTPYVKVIATKGFGARVVLQGSNYDEAYHGAKKFCEEEKCIFVHPYEDDDIIAGQGTIALELIEDLQGFDRVLVPIGGGGLISGIVIALKELSPKTQVIGVQTQACPSMYEMFKREEISTSLYTRNDADNPKGSIAEGITVKKVSPKNLEIIQKYVDDIVLVSEEEIAQAILLLMERSKTVVEGAGAASMAAALKGYVKGKTVVVLSGGNIDVTMISKIIERGLAHEGRLLRVSVKLPDKPGSLHALTEVLFKVSANILQIEHDRLAKGLAFGETDVILALETKGQEHIEQILAALKNKEYHSVILTG